MQTHTYNHVVHKRSTVEQRCLAAIWPFNRIVYLAVDDMSWYTAFQVHMCNLDITKASHQRVM